MSESDIQKYIEFRNELTDEENQYLNNTSIEF